VAAAGAGRHVLISGASTGIGRATALHLDAMGFRVHAGVRKEADGLGLEQEAAGPLSHVILDVTDAAQIAAAAAQIGEQAPGGLWGLVNNAGIAVAGPLEYLPLEDWRWQLEVNLTGHVAVTQALMPHLRKTRGRIVNVTSIGGLIAFPFMGAYHAAKFGLEAVSHALRRELRPWGMHVCSVEPGSIATNIWERGDEIADEVRRKLPAEAEENYGQTLDDYQELLQRTAERGIEPVKVAKVIEHALTSSRPRTRYLVGTDARVQARVAKVLPDGVMDALIDRGIKS
jgi:NAD(P)-dependent dehydrogenase (short-subunit alcohol dehydrogenase family)